VRRRSTQGFTLATWPVEGPHLRKITMWFLVQVVKGSKFYDPESQVANRVLISDTTEMVISGRAMGADGYRFEARRAGDSFVVRDFPGAQPSGSLTEQFTKLAQQFGAVSMSGKA
jgi:hypothetical protein